MASLMDEIMRQYQPSAEERAYAQANPDQLSGLVDAFGRGGAAINRSLVGAGESVGGVRAPSFQRLAQAAAMSQAINPARAEVGNQALSQAASDRAMRDAVRGSFVSSSPFYGEPEGLGRPNVTPSGPSNPMATLGTPAQQRVDFERMARIGAPTQPLGGNYNDVFNVPYTPTAQPLGGNYNDVFNVPYTPAQANPLANPALNQPVVAGLDAANRPAPMASSTSAPARQQGFFEKLFKGPDYQSNNALLQAEGQPINWGGAMTPQLMADKKIGMVPSYITSDNAADFFRADALLQQQDPARFGLLGGNNG
jgi:hypothetical protein